MEKTFFKKIYDLLFAPFRLVILPDNTCEKLGLTSLRQERIFNVLPNLKGKLLDIGCGDNYLVKMYGNGIGIDTYDWGGGATVIKNCDKLPFNDESFDTVTLLASLNHIPERKELIKEIHRVLKKDGKVVITMINPFIGLIGHKIWWYSEDKQRGMKRGETYGLWNKDIILIFEINKFKKELHQRFVYGLNNLFVFKKNYKNKV
ncbi:MAG: class I SAM-dependent methyltransferase [bacterium]|nr:class I SAM-dependent methyltransferase [bacterium]